MLFDPDNHIIQLCAQGMELEGSGDIAGASELFSQAWSAADNDMEKSIAAHYIARHQPSVSDKLQWDETALLHALIIHTEEIRSMYPSLYLNIAKCYEDLQQPGKAQEYYLLANLYVHYLADDGYGNMIKSGISAGLERTAV